MPKELTYQELVNKRDKEWARASQGHAEAWDARQKWIQEQPDVQNKPDRLQPWSSKGLACPQCTYAQFIVTRYITVNGVKQSWRGTCAKCHSALAWSWVTNQWLAN